MKLAFFGLGRMGQGMAANLMKKGGDVCVYNRSIAKAEPLRALGAKVGETPTRAAEGADIVFTILADDAALTATVTKDVLAAMAPGGIHVSMSTISTDLAASMAESHAALGRTYLGCPVFGRPDAAASGNLRLCLAGPDEAKAKTLPLLESFGEVWDFGASPAGAHAVKLAGNFMIATIIETLGEAYTLVEKNGVAPEKFYELVSSTFLAAPTVRNYGKMILDADFDNAGFAAKLGAKDVGLIRQAARRTNTPMPIAAVLEERFLRVLAKGWGDKDWMVTTRAQREDAGLAT